MQVDVRGMPRRSRNVSGAGSGRKSKENQAEKAPDQGGVEGRLFWGQGSSPRSGVVWHTWARPAQLGVCCAVAWPCPGLQPAQTRCLSLAAWVPDGTLTGYFRPNFRRDCRPNPTSWIKSFCNPKTSTKKRSPPPPLPITGYLKAVWRDLSFVATWHWNWSAGMIFPGN